MLEAGSGGVALADTTDSQLNFEATGNPDSGYFWTSQAFYTTGSDFDYGVNVAGNTVGVQGTSTGGTGVVGNGSSGQGVKGVSQGVEGVYGLHGAGSGLSAGGAGVAGDSDGTPGVVGLSSGAHGVYGKTGNANQAGVYGDGGSAATGVWGATTGSGKQGVYGYSLSWDGVVGETSTNQHAGVAGHNLSGGGSGVYGAGSPGVYGTSGGGYGVQGQSTGSEGLYGYSLNANGVHGNSTWGYGGVFERGIAHLQLVIADGEYPGPPGTLSSGHSYQAGSFFIDGNAVMYHCIGSGNPGTWVPFRSTLPLNPTRVLDTRTGTGGYSGAQPVGAKLTLALSGGSLGANGHTTPLGIPDATIALIGTLRAYAPSGAGYLTAYPGSGAPPTASNVNFSNGITIADQVLVGLGGNQLSIYVGGIAGASTQIVFDISGYII